MNKSYGLLTSYTLQFEAIMGQRQLTWTATIDYGLNSKIQPKLLVKKMIEFDRYQFDYISGREFSKAHLASYHPLLKYRYASVGAFCRLYLRSSRSTRLSS